MRNAAIVQLKKMDIPDLAVDNYRNNSETINEHVTV